MIKWFVIFSLETKLSSVLGFTEPCKWCSAEILAPPSAQIPAESLERHQQPVSLSEGLPEMPVSSISSCVCFCWGDLYGGADDL